MLGSETKVSAEGSASAALVPAQASSLSKSRVTSLAGRGRDLLHRKEEAESWLRKGLALQKSAPAEELSGDEEGKFGQLRARETALSEAFCCFERGHELDPSNPELMYQLAAAYRFGEGVQEDQQRALGLYQRAADIGSPKSLCAIADAYEHSGWDIVERDLEKAAKLYEAAVEQGDEGAVWIVVENYQLGIGVKQDHPAAARLLHKAATNGNEWAKRKLQDSLKEFGDIYGDCNDTTL